MKKNPFYINPFVSKKIFGSNLHIGGKKHLAVLDMYSYFYGIRQNFFIYDLLTFFSLFNKAILYLKYLISSDKKILFIGLPVGIEHLFLKFLKRFGHYVVDEKTIGVLTNYRELGLSKKFKIKKKPSLIFIFQPLDPDHQILLKSLFSFNIPIMGFVNINDPVDSFDFPLPGCIDSVWGSLFVYNLFLHLFGMKEDKLNFKKKKKILNFKNYKSFQSKKSVKYKKKKL